VAAAPARGGASGVFRGPRLPGGGFDLGQGGGREPADGGVGVPQGPAEGGDGHNSRVADAAQRQGGQPAVLHDVALQ
jgi:hypothetical protein